MMRPDPTTEKEKPVACYIKNELIIELDFTEPVIAKFFNQFEDCAKINWSVSALKEFVATKLYDVFQICRSRHQVNDHPPVCKAAGKRHYHLVPLPNFISNMESFWRTRSTRTK